MAKVNEAEQIQAYLTTHLTATPFSACHYFTSLDYIPQMSAYLARAIMSIYCEKPEVHTYEWPADWWSALKLSKFPKWLLRYYPPKMKQVEIKVFPAYPEINPETKQKTVTLRTIENREFYKEHENDQ